MFWSAATDCDEWTGSPKRRRSAFPGVRTRMSNAAFRRRGTAIGVDVKLAAALACNGLLDGAFFSSPPRHTRPRLMLCVRHLTLATGARQLTAMNGQLHRSGGAMPCQDLARGCLTRRSGGAGTARGVAEK